MTQIDNTEKTNRAWHTLHSRLEQDGLLTGNKTDNTHSLSHPKAWLYAAAITLLCVAGISSFFLKETNGTTAQELVTLQNGKDSMTLVTTLEDGSIVYLADNTELQFPEHFQKNKREVSLQGNALFDVSGNRERPFLIETKQVQIEVLGTAFNVKSAKGKPFELSVQRGEVKVTLKDNGLSTLVKAGETVTRSPGGLQVSLTQDTGQFAWYTGHMQFKDEKLSDILRILNKQDSGTQIQISPSLEDRRLTVSFSNDSPDTMAELICLALNLKYTKEENRLTLSEP